MNHQQHIDQLLEKFRRNACTPDELQELHNWLDIKAVAGEEYPFTDEERAQLKNRMREAVFASVMAKAPVKTINRFRWIKYAAACAGILLIGSAVAWFMNRPHF